MSPQCNLFNWHIYIAGRHDHLNHFCFSWTIFFSHTHTHIPYTCASQTRERHLSLYERKTLWTDAVERSKTLHRCPVICVKGLQPGTCQYPTVFFFQLCINWGKTEFPQWSDNTLCIPPRISENILPQWNPKLAAILSQRVVKCLQLEAASNSASCKLNLIVLNHSLLICGNGFYWEQNTAWFTSLTICSVWKLLVWIRAFSAYMPSKVSEVSKRTHHFSISRI